MPTLPLTVFEEYLFHENSDEFPCNTWLKADFDGRVNPASLEKAVSIASKRHPLLTARLVNTRLGRPAWELDPERSLPIVFRKQDDSAPHTGFESIDPKTDPPFSILISYGPERWRFFVLQHHAVSDGAGSLAFFHEVLIAYDAIENNQAVELPPLETERLASRNRYGLTLGKRLALIPAQIAGLLISTTLFRRRVSPITPSQTPAPRLLKLPQDAPRYRTKTLSKTQYIAFRRAAKTMGYSVNDLLLAYFHFAIGAFREERGFGSPSDWIRVSVPVNLRSKADKRLSACNAISIVSIDREAKGLSNKKRLIRRAKEDMQLIKKGNLGLTFLIVLWIRRHLPGGIRSFCKRDTPRTTSVYTNVGQQFAHSRLRQSDGKLACGGSRLETFTSIAPFRPYSHATLQTSVYAGELRMTLHYDSREMPAAHADRLLELFEQEILQIATG